jgi:hypothetical protein
MMARICTRVLGSLMRLVTQSEALTKPMSLNHETKKDYQRQQAQGALPGYSILVFGTEMDVHSRAPVRIAARPLVRDWAVNCGEVVA